jgi:hypothetical protein
VLLGSLEDQNISPELLNNMDLSEDETISEDPASSQSSGHAFELLDTTTDQPGAEFDDIMDEDNAIDAVDVPMMIEEDEGDGEWWDQYAVREDIAPTTEDGAEEAEDFEELLHWIDQEMLLEVSEGCESFAKYMQRNSDMSQPGIY